MSFKIIKPFLKFIEHLLDDETISEIMINESQRVFVERLGVVEEQKEIKVNPKSLMIAVQNIASVLKIELNENNPVLNARLPDGSRVCAVIPPVSMGGITFDVRKFNAKNFTINDLIKLNTISEDTAKFLKEKISEHKNIMISGGTGTGKTTLLNILADFIPENERVIVIEDTAEINMRKENLVRLEAKKDTASIQELLKASLRLRPDRIVVGEIRGGEAFDLLQALNTGHSGSLSTIHANNALKCLQRLESCVLMAGLELPFYAIQSFIADSIDYIVHIKRIGSKRYVDEILNVCGFDHESRIYKTSVDFKRSY